MRGVSLIETIIVIAVISFLSTIGVNSFINFKNDATINNITDELISDIKLARNKSMNGELLQSESVSEFSLNGLPEYGLSITEGSYKILRECLKEDEITTCETEALENLQYTDDFKIRAIDPQYKLMSSNSEFYFERITGKTEGQTITVAQKDDKYAREIEISSDFLITVIKK